MANKPQRIAKPEKFDEQAATDRPQAAEAEVELNAVFKSNFSGKLQANVKDPLRWVTGLHRCLNRIAADLAREKEERYTNERFEGVEELVKDLQKDTFALTGKVETLRGKAEDCIGELWDDWWKFLEAEN